MRRIIAFWLFLSVLLSFTSCSKKAAHSLDRAERNAYSESSALLANVRAMPLAKGYLAAATERFIAVQHKLEVASTDERLAPAWQSVIKFCGTLQCEVTASSITARSGESPASGSIALRVAPQDFPKLLTQVEQEGNIVQHTTINENKTDAVVDTEARLKNLTAYRDSLRSMLGRSGLNVKDSVEIQEKLTDVQSDLDSETAKRKILANETGKVAVEIEFRVKNPGNRRSAFAPLGRALQESSEVLAESLGSLVTFTVAIVPWVLVILLGIWILVRLRRRRRARKAALTNAAVGS